MSKVEDVKGMSRVFGSVGDATEPKLSGTVREGICEADTARTELGLIVGYPNGGHEAERNGSRAKEKHNKAEAEAPPVSNPILTGTSFRGITCLVDP